MSICSQRIPMKPLHTLHIMYSCPMSSNKNETRDRVSEWVIRKIIIVLSSSMLLYIGQVNIKSFGSYDFLVGAFQTGITNKLTAIECRLVLKIANAFSVI